MVLILDQVSKLWAKSHLENTSGLVILPNWLELFYAENTGIAFSTFAKYPLVLTFIISVILLYLIYYCYEKKFLNLAYTLILAGGLGNLIDRFHYGYVVDFINPVFIDFAIFNIADISLNLGMFLFLINFIKEKCK